MSQTAAMVEQLFKSCARKSADYRRSVCYSVVRNGKLVDGYRDSGADISLASRKIMGTEDYLRDNGVKIQGIQGEFCEISLAKICVKSPRFGTKENVEITVEFYQI